MLMQTLIVAALVLGCTGHALWTLMPAAARRAVAARVLRLRLPEPLARPFARAMQPQSACGACGDCGSTTAKPIRIHRRR